MLKEELKELRSLKTNDLETKRLDFEREVFNLRMMKKTMQLNDTSRIKKVRHLIAFINMLLTQRELSEV